MINQFLLDMVNQCINLCEREKKGGYQGEATQDQIENYILPEMHDLKMKILCNRLPDDRYVVAFGYAFKVWNWCMENPSELYLALLKLHTAYEQSQCSIGDASIVPLE